MNSSTVDTGDAATRGGSVRVSFHYVDPRSPRVDLHFDGLGDRSAHIMEAGSDGVHRLDMVLPDTTCTSYGFLPRSNIDAGAVPEREVSDRLRADPSNSVVIPRAFGSAGSTSVLELAAARRHSAWVGIEQAPAGTVRRLILPSGREVALREPTRSPDAVVIMLDGAVWADEALGFARALDRYEASTGRAVQVAMVDTSDRENLPDREMMAELLRSEVLPAVQPEDDVIVCGQSYGGLAAAALLVDCPDVVAGAILQSGSYWYEPDVDADSRDFDAPGLLAREIPTRRVSGRCVVQAGSRENDMLRQSREFAETLAQSGAAVSVDVFEGGHDYAWYRHGFFFALDELVVLTP